MENAFPQPSWGELWFWDQGRGNHCWLLLSYTGVVKGFYEEQVWAQADENQISSFSLPLPLPAEVRLDGFVCWACSCWEGSSPQQGGCFCLSSGKGSRKQLCRLIGSLSDVYLPSPPRHRDHPAVGRWARPPSWSSSGTPCRSFTWDLQVPLLACSHLGQPFSSAFAVTILTDPKHGPGCHRLCLLHISILLWIFWSECPGFPHCLFLVCTRNSVAAP